MGGKIIEVVLLKAVAGGLYVLMFAALAAMLKPKSLAGVLSAAPSIALGGLLVTAVFSGQAEMRAAAEGMQVGAVAFLLHCLVMARFLEAWGTWRTCFAALGVWLVTAAAGYLLLRP